MPSLYGTFEESKHPRASPGSREGGRFVSKGGKAQGLSPKSGSAKGGGSVKGGVSVKVARRLTDQEIDAVQLRTGDYYAAINAVQVGATKVEGISSGFSAKKLSAKNINQVKAAIPLIKSAIETRELSSDGVVYRGIGGELLTKMLKNGVESHVGKSISAKTFMSTTLRLKGGSMATGAEGFGGFAGDMSKRALESGRATQESIILKINLRKGQHALPIYNAPGLAGTSPASVVEREVLIKPGMLTVRGVSTEVRTRKLYQNRYREVVHLVDVDYEESQ